MDDGSGRLIPRWYTATVLLLLTIGTSVFLGLSFAADGPLGWSFRAGSMAAALLLVAACSAFLRPRRRREPRIVGENVRVFSAPGATVWPLLGAWVTLLVLAGLWGWVAVTNSSALESPGFVLLTIAGAVASLPDLVRLLTGRLHRWRLEVGPDAMTYRGYRTDRTVPWAKVHGARIQSRGPAGVAIDVKGAGVDPVIPITAFDVPAEQLVEEIRLAKDAAAR